MRVKIPRDRLTMCRWIGSHFHDCIDFYGVAFSAIFSRVTRINKRLPFHSGLVQKRTNMGSLIGHNIGQNTAEVLRSQLYLPRKNYLCTPRGVSIIYSVTMISIFAIALLSIFFLNTLVY